MKGVNASFNINYNFNKYQKTKPADSFKRKKKKELSWQTMLGYNYIDSEQKTSNLQEFTAFNPMQYLKQENFTVTQTETCILD